VIDPFLFAPDISIGKVKVNKYQTSMIRESEGKLGTQIRGKKGRAFLFESKPSGLIENQQADDSMCMDDWL